MMGSSHLDHYHQEELHGFSSLATVAAFYDLPSCREWNQSQILGCGEFVTNASTGLLCGQSHDVSPVTSQTIQELGFHHLTGINNQESFLNQLPSGHQLDVEKAKADLPDNAFPKLNEFFKDHPDGDYRGQQLHQKLFVRALASSECQVDGLRALPAGNMPETPPGFDEYGGGRENFNCMAFRTCGLLQSSSHPPIIASGSLDMDLRALDLLASARLGRSFCQPPLAGMNLLREDASSGLDQLQESIRGPFYHHQKMPSLVSGVAEANGSTSTWEHKSSQTAPRKPRFEQRSSFSPFKVRKEKLGDRIAALQQLVAPFGKTDTASVLMEAIGYIKFLLDQVEKLSVPYMRSSGNKRSRTVKEATDEESSYEAKRDLRSRGLCLVPLSCTSYMTTEHGVWSPPNYGGGTRTG